LAEVDHKEGCPRCIKNGRDNSRDNLIVYKDDGGAFCFSCGYTVKSKSIEDEKEEDLFLESMAVFTDEDLQKLKDNTTTDGSDYRCIRDDIYAYFRVRHEYDTESLDLVKQFYPNTKGGELCGYKVRALPKEFYSLGTNSSTTDLFGQFRFLKTTSNWCLIVGGEIDQLSAYQMLVDYQASRGSDFAPIAVVSPTVGETSAAKQLQHHYEWFSRFEKIILCFDNDAPGRDATEKAVKVLPKGKVFILEMERKDPNEYLESGREKEFINAFFKARQYAPAGILGSDRLRDRIIEHVRTPKIPLPPFLKKLMEMTAGGIPLGVIVNIGAASGVGKTSIVNEMTYYWIFNSPHRIGVVSLELDAGQYGEAMLSRHVGVKIPLISDPEKKLAFLEREDIFQKSIEFFEHEDGSPRWHVVDDRDGSLTTIKAVIENLVVACDCRVIIIDPLQDLLDGLSNEEQSLFMKWQKSVVKSHGITFININHVRKSGVGGQQNSQGAFITEEDFAGSSTIFKSAAGNFLFMRNKYAEDEFERNTVKCVASKIRWTGNTGPAGEAYYDNQTHTLWEKEEYMREHGIVLDDNESSN
jgi:archaellum biogenesis ATPase FlaH